MVRHKDALQKAAKCCLRLEKRRQPDWFRDSYNCLKPLIEDRNKLYARWVSTGNQEDKRKYCTQRRFTRKVIREAKNKWFQQKASEAQKGRHGSLVWRFIREMQHGRRGLIPVRSKAVKDENGIACTSPKAQHQRWRQHFSKVLNLQSQFDESE